MHRHGMPKIAPVIRMLKSDAEKYLPNHQMFLESRSVARGCLPV